MIKLLDERTVSAGAQTPLRDPLTKALRNINCKENIDHLLTKFAGKEVVLYFIDINGMGPTDKRGGITSKRVDQFIRLLVKIAEKKFTNVEIVRYGGDEFGIIAEYNEKVTEKEALAFVSGMEELRQKMFPISDPDVKAAQMFANYRSLLRNKIEDKIKKLNESQFDIREGDSFAEIVKKVSFYADRVIRQAIIERKGHDIIIRQKEKFTIFPVMSLQIASSYLFKVDAPDLLSEQLHLAYAVAARNASQQKKYTNFQDRIIKYEEKNFIPIEQPLKDMPKLRSSELVEVKNARKLSEKIIQAKLNSQSKAEIKSLELQDANLNTPVLRGEMLAGVLFADIATLTATCTLYTGKLSISSFGLYNSVYGYERANQFFDSFAQLVNQTFPSALLVRQGGGDLGIISKEPLYGAELNELAHNISDQFHHQLISNDPEKKDGSIRAYFELLMQANIKELYGAEQNRDAKFVPGEVKVSSSPIDVQVSQSTPIQNLLH